MLVDLRPEGLDGAWAEWVLELVSITANRNPFLETQVPSLRGAFGLGPQP